MPGWAGVQPTPDFSLVEVEITNSYISTIVIHIYPHQEKNHGKHDFG
jgi:hypothetical protein